MRLTFRSFVPLMTLCFAALSVAAMGYGQSALPQPADPIPTRSGETLDIAALEEYLRYVNLWNSEVTVTLAKPQPSSMLPGFFDVTVTASIPGASLTQEYFVSPDGSRIIRARASDRLGKTVFDTGQYPFQAEQAALDTNGRPAVGPDGAPVTLTVFSDFQCAYCRDEAKLLRANLETAYPDAVRLVFIDFPLFQIHNWAKPAAIAGHCVAAQSQPAFWSYHDWIFDVQPQITAENFSEKLQGWLQSTKIDGLQLQQCRQSPGAESAVMASFQKAISLGLNSTPTLFVNGRQLGGKLEWAALKQVIETELDYIRKQDTKQSASKEECCTVTLPGLFPQ